MFKKYIKNFSYLCTAIFLISCSSLTPYKVPVLQGNLFEEKDIDKLSAGLTKEQVQFILGTALIKDPFHSQRCHCDHESDQHAKQCMALC